MVYYDRTDVSEEINVNKAINICHYCYFLNKDFNFQPNVCNKCHDLFMMSMNLIDIIILNIKTTDYFCSISGINKSEAINITQNIDLTEKIGTS